MSKKKKVDLILGSGGARGIAHISVIEGLLKDGYEINRVVGCSMGAVVGGVYCAGFLEVYKNWLLTINRTQLFNLLDFTITNMGFLKGERVLGKMQEITGNQKIEDLPIPFVAVAADMIKRKEVYFTEGDMYAAIRASMSIPGVFTPIWHDGSILVDGGVLNPLPLNLAKKDSDTLVVAVSLNGPNPTLNIKNETTEPLTPSNLKEENAMVSLAKTWWSKWFPQDKVKQKNQAKFSVIDLLAHSYEFTQDRLVELTIQTYKPDMVVQIPSNSCNIFEFHKAAHMLSVGEEAYAEAIKEFHASQNPSGTS
jgi:NTE family protein